MEAAIGFIATMYISILIFMIILIIAACWSLDCQRPRVVLQPTSGDEAGQGIDAINIPLQDPTKLSVSSELFYNISKLDHPNSVKVDETSETDAPTPSEWNEL